MLVTVAGCTTQGGDHQDSGVDARDGRIHRDVPVIDTQFGQDDVPAVEPDASFVEDAAACPATRDPIGWFLSVPTVMAMRGDNSALFEPVDQTSARVFLRRGDALPPDLAAGECIYRAIARSGSNERNAAPDMNFGTVTMTQGARQVVGTFDPSRNIYSVDSSMGRPLLPNVGVDLLFAGGPDGPRTSTSLVMPPALALTPSGGTFVPSTFSRTHDNLIHWETPAGVQPDDTFLVWILDFTFNNSTVCAVAGCRRSVSIPASIIQRYPMGTNFLVSLYAARRQTVSVGGTAVNYIIGNGGSLQARVE